MVVSQVIKRQKYERLKLSSSQIVLLELLYKYRFGSRELIGSSLGINGKSSLHERLLVLEKYGYVDVRVDIRSKGIKKPSAYFVAPKGLKALQALADHEHIGDRALRLTYQNKTSLHDTYVAHTLNVFAYTQHIKHLYPALKVFTERDMECYSYFPDKPPDAFLSLASGDPEQPHRFFFDIVRDRKSRRELDNKLSTYNEFFDSGGWKETDSPLPVILLACEWSPDERSVQRRVRGLLNRLGIELRVYTTTAHALENSGTPKAIWTNVDGSEEPVSLEAISIS